MLQSFTNETNFINENYDEIYDLNVSVKSSHLTVYNGYLYYYKVSETVDLGQVRFLINVLKIRKKVV